MSPTCFLTNKIIQFYLIVGGVPKRSSFKLLKWGFFNLFLFLFFSLFERECEWGRGTEEERESFF